MERKTKKKLYQYKAAQSENFGNKRGINRDITGERKSAKIENTSQQGSNDPRVQKERQGEWARPGRVFNRNTNRGGYLRNPLPGVTREFRVVKDNRQKAVGETVPESFHDGDQIASNIGDKRSTEKMSAQCHSVTQNSNGRGAAQADNGCKIAAQAHDKEVKPCNDQKVGQSDGIITTMVGSHAVLGRCNQNGVLAMPSGTNNFTGELCCSSSDPIHVPSPGSRSAGTFGAIKREVGVVGARQPPFDNAATNTSTSNSSVKMSSVSTATKDNASNGQQTRFSGVSLKNSRPSSSTHLSTRPSSSSQYHSKPNTPVGHPKVNPQLAWKPKSGSSNPVNHTDNVVSSSAASSVDGKQAHMADLSKKLSQANVSEDKHVIIPAHLRVCTSAPDAPTNTEFNAHTSRSTDVPPTDQMDIVGSCDILPKSDSLVSISEHQHPTEDMEILSPGVIGEHRSNDKISSQVSHSSPQPQHQDNSAVHDFKTYEPDSGYELPFIIKAVDSEATQNIPYPSEVIHAANFNQLSVPVSTQQAVPQMYQHMHVPQYPNCLPYRHVFSPYYVPPMAVQNYPSNPAFTQLPNASSYLVMPNGTSQLAPNGMKYGPPHQCKQVFPGGPAGYGGFPNQNGYPVNTAVIGSTGTVEDANMSYKDNNLYTLNPQAETADLWIQAPTDIPVMPSAPYYNMMGQPVSPHTAYLPAHNGHAPFSPVQHPAHLQFPAMPHGLQPTTMTMVQNPQSMVHHPAGPPLAGNIGIDMSAMASGAQVGAFQQNQLSHLGWAPSF
uniref:GBF-interacting protein 1 N-terminal domain-containing protein n=1 Tax=Leersia perrieri TaxID=77586 RepID=A0A0D9VV67_9ORYZ